MTLHERGGGDGTAAGFLDLPSLIYRDDPNWIPEDRDAVAAGFGAASPWAARGALHSVCVPRAARASVFRPRGLEIADEPAAFFGHWESTGDRSADALVMDAARALAREAGAARLYGPVNFSTGVLHCIRTGGDMRAMPYVGEPYNPPGYPDGLAALGLALCRHYIGLELAEPDIRRLASAGKPVTLELIERGYRLERLTIETWLDRLEELRDLANAVFRSNFAFEPFSRREFQVQFDTAWAGRLDPETSILALAPDGEAAGVVLCYPHYAPILVQGAGVTRVATRHVSYRTHERVLAGLSQPTTVLKTAGVSPRHRRVGLVTAMIATAARRALSRGTERILLGPMHSENVAIRRVFRHGQRAERRYGIYSADLEGNGRA